MALFIGGVALGEGHLRFPWHLKNMLFKSKLDHETPGTPGKNKHLEEKNTGPFFAFEQKSVV